jgi:hemolysin activation/secretion protein
VQSYFTSSLNSALIGGDTLGINLSTVPDVPKELGFGRAFYNLPIGLDGARIGGVASYGESRPADQAEFDTRSRAQYYELRGSLVPLRTRESTLWLSASAGLSETSEHDVLSTHYRDHVRSVTVTADYQMHDSLNGWNYLTLIGRQGFNVLGASQADDPLLSRWDGSGTFSKGQFYYTRYQPLSDIWSVKISAAGQLASRGLLASEEFYLWSAFGRGYYGADVSGDNAIAGSLELRFDQVLNNSFLKGYQLYGYIDRTQAWNFHSDGSGPLSLSLTGVGARFYLASDWQAGIEAAVPLEYHTPISRPREARAFFYLSKFLKLCPGSAEMRCS